MDIRIGTSEVGGTFDTQGAAIADRLNRTTGPIGTAVTSPSINASVDNANRLNSADIEFGFMASNWIGRALKGEAPFTSKISLRMVTPANAGPLFFIVRDDSPLRTVRDMVGRRVSIGPAQSGMTQHVHTMFGVLGISFDEFTPVHLNFEDGADALVAGDIDAQFQCPIPNKVMTDLSQRAHVRVLEYGDGELDQLIDGVPFYRPTTMKSGAFRGLNNDTAQVAVLNVIVTHKRIPDDVVAAFVASMISDLPALANANPLFDDLEALYEPLRSDGPSALEPGGVKLHPGALTAYRDAGYLD